MVLAGGDVVWFVLKGLSTCPVENQAQWSRRGGQETPRLLRGLGEVTACARLGSGGAET